MTLGIPGMGTAFQSTLPRGERLSLVKFAPANVKISIHAPARGATRLAVRDFNFLQDFNPRSREGSDPSSKMITGFTL